MRTDAAQYFETMHSPPLASPVPPRYFETRPKWPDGGTGDTGWAGMPRDVLRQVLRLTGDNPLRYAGVCKGWSWVLDDEVHRRDIAFRYGRAPGLLCSLQQSARSLARFVCKRPPATEALDIHVSFSLGLTDYGIIIAALTPVLAHLAPTLRTVVIDPNMPDLFTATPLTGGCRRAGAFWCIAFLVHR